MSSLVLKSRSLHRADRLGRWQIVLLCLSLLAVGVAVFLEVQITLAERRVTEAERQFEQNRALLETLKQRVAEIEASELVELPTPESIRASTIRFEEEFLNSGEEAQLAAIRQVDQLARESGVIPLEINFNPIEQKALEGEGGLAGGQRGARSLFPGLEMSFTVEGSYGDVRRFLISLQNCPTFLIINSLDLKSIEPAALGGRARLISGTATDQVIALGIKLAVYYQRERP